MLQENGRLGDIVRRVNDLHPDLVVITGDLVDEDVSHMEEMVIPLANLKSRLGVLAMMGNHEFFAGVKRAESIMRQAGIQVLRNEIKALPGGLQVLGVDDPAVSRRRGLPLPDFDGLRQKARSGKPSILLYHQPVHFEEVADARGRATIERPHSWTPIMAHGSLCSTFLFASAGSFPEWERVIYMLAGVSEREDRPMRLGSPPEMVYIRLRSPEK